MTARALVVGAGPAGISTAMWLNDLEVPFDWVDAATQAGGTLQRVGNPIRHVVGGPWSNGFELANDMRRQIATLGLAPETGVRVQRIDAAGGAVEVDLGEAGQRRYEAVVLCTGTRPRLLGLPNESALLGRGVEISVTRNLDRYRDLPVAVVGGGDAALEGALLLADVCPEVHLIHRRDGFAGQRRFVERVESTAKIRIHRSTEVTRVFGLVDGEPAGPIGLSDGTELDVSALFVRIGVEPAPPPGLPIRCLDSSGYLVADASGRLPAPGLWAAGDVVSGAHHSVAFAMGMGAVVASSVQLALSSLSEPANS